LLKFGIGEKFGLVYYECMCRIIAFVGSVGGVGKTSLVFEFAKYLSMIKKKVCVFDGCFGNIDVVGCLFIFAHHVFTIFVR
jgi:septum formation inhibitor-activating ATPase MinD